MTQAVGRFYDNLGHASSLLSTSLSLEPSPQVLRDAFAFPHSSLLLDRLCFIAPTQLAQRQNPAAHCIDCHLVIRSMNLAAELSAALVEIGGRVQIPLSRTTYSQD